MRVTNCVAIALLMLVLTGSLAHGQPGNAGRGKRSTLSAVFWPRDTDLIPTVDGVPQEAPRYAGLPTLQVYSENAHLIFTTREYGYGEEVSSPGICRMIRLKDPAYDKAFLSYAVSSYTFLSEYTYPLAGSGKGLPYRVESIPEDYALVFDAENLVADQLEGPALYIGGFLDGALNDIELEVDYLEGNAVYGSPVDVVNGERVGLYTTQFVFSDHFIPGADPTIAHYLFVKEEMPVGPIRASVGIDGYTDGIIETDLRIQTKEFWSFLIAPSAVDSYGPSDYIASSPFRFPPPSAMMTFAREDSVLGKSIVFGYMEKAFEVAGELPFSAAAALDEPTSGTVVCTPKLSLDTVDASPGETAEVGIYIEGGVEDLRAAAVTIEIPSNAVATSGIEDMDFTPDTSLVDWDVRTHFINRRNGALELHLILISPADQPIDARERVRLGTIHVNIPTGIDHYVAAPMIVRTDIQDNVIQSSLVDTRMRRLTLPGTGDFIPVAAENGEIRIGQPPPDGWMVK